MSCIWFGSGVTEEDEVPGRKRCCVCLRNYAKGDGSLVCEQCRKCNAEEEAELDELEFWLSVGSDRRREVIEDE